MPTALITGAAGGIGSAIAEALAPTHTLLLAGRPSARLDALAERFDATTFPLDLADSDGIAAAVEVIDELDVLVHNAGVLATGPIADSTADEWRLSFEVNVIGAVTLTNALLPALRAAGGQVVFINSTAALQVSSGMAAYSASKYALRAVADALRATEPALRVTSVFPGRTDSAMQQELVAFEGAEYDAGKFLRPQTVAGVVAGVVATPPDGHLPEVVIRPR